MWGSCATGSVRDGAKHGFVQSSRSGCVRLPQCKAVQVGVGADVATCTHPLHVGVHQPVVQEVDVAGDEGAETQRLAEDASPDQQAARCAQR